MLETDRLTGQTFSTSYFTLSLSLSVLSMGMEAKSSGKGRLIPECQSLVPSRLVELQQQFGQHRAEQYNLSCTVLLQLGTSESRETVGAQHREQDVE